MALSNIEKESKYIYRIRKTGSMKVDAVVLSDYETIDEDAVEQIKNVATLPGIVHYALAMPDIHWGYGFPIGGVAAFDIEDGVISPGGVGFDINCGVRMLVVEGHSNLVKDNLEVIIQRLYEAIPVGVGERSEKKFSRKEFKEIVEKGAKKVIELGYGYQDDLERIEDFGCIRECDFSNVSEEAFERGKDELGTLGAGNHFLEVQEVAEVYDEEVAKILGVEKGMITVLIHTGSRGFGHQIATDYIKLMRDNLKEHNKNLPDKQLINAPLKVIGDRNTTVR